MAVQLTKEQKKAALLLEIQKEQQALLHARTSWAEDASLVTSPLRALRVENLPPAASATRRLEVKDGSGVVPCPRRADVHLEEQDAVLQQLSVTANWLQDARRVFDAVRSAVQAMGELLAEQQHLDVTRVQVEDAPLVGSLAESSEAERRGLRRELDALHRSDYGHIGPALPEEAHRATSSSVPEPGGQASTGADAADAIVRLESELSVLKAKLEDAELRHHEKASVLAARLQDAQSRLAEAGRGATAERAAAVAMSNSFKSELDEAAAQHGKTVIQLSEAEAALRASRDETAAALVQLEGAHEQLAEAVALAADLRQEVAEYADGLQVAENKAAACVEELRHKSAELAAVRQEVSEMQRQVDIQAAMRSKREVDLREAHESLNAADAENEMLAEQVRVQAQLLEASQIEAATARERLHRTERHVRVLQEQLQKGAEQMVDLRLTLHQRQQLRSGPGVAPVPTDAARDVEVQQLREQLDEEARSARLYKAQCEQLQWTTTELRMKLEDAEQRAQRWARRAGVAEAGSGARTMAAAEPQSPLQAHR